MYDIEEIIKCLRELKKELARKYGVIKIGVFGSYARSQQTQISDLDITVVMESSKKTLHNFFSLKRELEDIFKVKIDLSTEEALKPDMKKRILEEIIYV